VKITKTQLKEIIKEELKTVLGESLEDEGRMWQEHVTNNPIHGMSPRASVRMFTGWLQDMVQYGEISPPRALEDVIAAYDKLRRIQDPEDRSHMAAYGG
jgi:hypothetical protein